MNATSLSELRQQADQQTGQDQRMEQVRQLLFGDAVQALEVRIAALEANLKTLDQAVAEKLESIAGRVDALAGDLDTSHRTAFEQLSKSLLDLGERVRGIAKG